MKRYNVAILGATGAVGREMMKILAERSFPVEELRLLASPRSAGQKHRPAPSGQLPPPLRCPGGDHQQPG